MKSNKKIVGILGVATLICLSLITVFSLQTQKSSNTVISENEQIIDVVKLFWELTENGKLTEAQALTTNSYKGMTVTVKDQEALQDWIYKYKWSYISANIHKEPNDGKCIVAVKVKDNDREFYLAHDLVKNDKGEWKIISISY